MSEAIPLRRKRLPPGYGEPIPNPQEPIAGLLFPCFAEVEWCENRIGPLRPCEPVVAQGKRGLHMARILYPQVPLASTLMVTGRVLRRPTEQDWAQWRRSALRAQEALRIVEERVRFYGLPMRLLKAHCSLDGQYYIFFYRAPERVDFRALVRDLADRFRTRIELRQLGPREQAQLLGGLGPCGRPLCCATFLHHFCAVTVRMAKAQNLPVESGREMGLCGRLKCCVRYEYEQYIHQSPNGFEEKEERQ